MLGLGSNILAADAGVRGVVIKLAERFSRIEVDGCAVRAQAGASNEAVAEAACATRPAGYEFASGIPGTVGGAAIMNAGAYDGEFRDVATTVSCLTPEGDMVEVSAEQAAWSYRRSMMSEQGYVVLGVTLLLERATTRLPFVRGWTIWLAAARRNSLSRCRARVLPSSVPSGISRASSSRMRACAGIASAALRCRRSTRVSW